MQNLITRELASDRLGVICHDVFRSADLDLQSLCPEHRGELDDHESEE